LDQQTVVTKEGRHELDVGTPGLVMALAATVKT